MSKQLIPNRTNNRLGLIVGVLLLIFHILNPQVQADTLSKQHINDMLAQVNKIKSSNKTAAANIIALLQQQEKLTTLQQEELTYQHAYNLYLHGDRNQSVKLHQQLQSSTNIDNRIRANSTLLNLYLVERNYPLAAPLIDGLLEDIEKTKHFERKNSAYRVIAYYYNELDAFDLAIVFLNLIDPTHSSTRAQCYNKSFRVPSLLGLYGYSARKDIIDEAIAFCESVNENISAKLDKVLIAEYHLKAQRFLQAKQLLLDNLSAVEAINYPNLSFRMYTYLAKANYPLGEYTKAKLYAEKALQVPLQLKVTRATSDLYKVLSDLALKENNEQKALEYLTIYQQKLKANIYIDQQKDIAREQIKHTAYSKSRYKDKLANELNDSMTKNSQASKISNLYAENFAYNRMVFVIQIGIICLLGASLLYLRHLQLRSKDKSNYDPLTTLLNRIGFIDSAVSTVSLQRSNKAELAVLVVNIDNFRTFNQTIGTAQGDNLLIELSQLLSSFVDGSHHIGRTGADEFTLVFPNKNSATLKPVARAIQSQIASLSSRLNHSLKLANNPVTVSMAFSDSNLSDYSLKYFFTDTSKALMKVKALGGDHICCFDKTMAERNNYKVDENELKYIYE
ncbi:tetratricopeptide repeat-containing diguanylate cyclase [Thalassotalea sp. ND16A]|uniref:tetratricopeptide repeat-containing diguanylate cyclase n=1 Tax=Thalassotalea sp. ND16A TaxID=1535422 RepID=UPI00051A5C66|nr:GGDEF domain-containing protein [Thalassotalea sp. ND16A]KGJ89408.1 putative diguanylate cyclase [Thalassotalea sp. ND16A]